jgi:predicted ribosome-associated RNA-binding protein Tma20/uncharacterized protein YehS (DUF1456 family)
MFRSGKIRWELSQGGTVLTPAAVKDLLLGVNHQLPRLSNNDLTNLFPKNVHVTKLKLSPPPSSSKSGYDLSCSCFIVYGVPLLFDISTMGEQNLFPTVFLLWRYPHCLDALHVQAPVSGALLKGADLNIAGIAALEELDGIATGTKCAICVQGNPVPFALGVSTWGSKASKGIKAVIVYHSFGDQLGRMADHFHLSLPQGFATDFSGVSSLGVSPNGSGGGNGNKITNDFNGDGRSGMGGHGNTSEGLQLVRKQIQFVQSSADEQIESLERQQAALLRLHDDTADRVNIVENQLDTLQSSAYETEKRSEEAYTGLQAITASLGNLDPVNLMQDIKEQNTALWASVRQLEKRVETINYENKIMRERNHVAYDEMQRLNGKANKLVEVNSKKDEMLKQMASEIQYLKEDNKKGKTQMNDMTIELNELKTLIMGREERQRQLEEELRLKNNALGEELRAAVSETKQEVVQVSTNLLRSVNTKNAETMQIPGVRMCGFISKQALSTKGIYKMINRWNRRYLVLKGTELVYNSEKLSSSTSSQDGSEQSQDEVKGTLQLDSTMTCVSCERLSVAGELGFEISEMGNKVIFTARAESLVERDNWIRAICEAINETTRRYNESRLSQQAVMKRVTGAGDATCGESVQEAHESRMPTQSSTISQIPVESDFSSVKSTGQHRLEAKESIQLVCGGYIFKYAVDTSKKRIINRLNKRFCMLELSPEGFDPGAVLRWGQSRDALSSGNYKNFLPLYADYSVQPSQGSSFDVLGLTNDILFSAKLSDAERRDRWVSEIKAVLWTLASRLNVENTIPSRSSTIAGEREERSKRGEQNINMSMVSDMSALTIAEGEARTYDKGNDANLQHDSEEDEDMEEWERDAHRRVETPPDTVRAMANNMGEEQWEIDSKAIKKVPVSIAPAENTTLSGYVMKR